MHTLGLRGLARVVSLALFAASLQCGVARADVPTVEGVDAPIVRIQIPAQANLTIRTWDRPAVTIEGPDAGSLVVERQTNRVPANLPPTLIRMGQIQTPGGPIVLPAESFVVSTLPAGPRNVVVIHGEPGHDFGPLTVTIPSDTALLAATVGRGSMLVQNYREGTFILHLHTGTAALENVGGDGFVQVLRGPILATDSNFNRLRARTAAGAEIFERCRSRQIEASSVNGAIVYDGGSFDTGLARFDSTNGPVAVGVSGPSQLAARSGSGKIFALFDRRAQVDNRESEATAVIDGGGPLVNATSGSGHVFLYDGTLRSKKLPAQWRAIATALVRAKANAGPTAEPAQPREPKGEPGKIEPTPRTQPPQRNPQPHNPPPPRPPGPKLFIRR